MSRNDLTRKDLETISAYLDGQLSPRQQAQFEARLAGDERLQTALEDLRRTRGLLRRAPRARAPRSFTLTPEMAGQLSRGRGWYPTMRLVSAIASILFVVVFASDLIGFSAAQQLGPQPEAVQELRAVHPQQEGDLAAGSSVGEEEGDFVEKAADAPLPPQPTLMPTQSLELESAADTGLADDAGAESMTAPAEEPAAAQIAQPKPTFTVSQEGVGGGADDSSQDMDSIEAVPTITLYSEEELNETPLSETQPVLVQPALESPQRDFTPLRWLEVMLAVVAVVSGLLAWRSRRSG